MSDYDWEGDEPYVVIEQRQPGIGPFIAGLAIGAGLALLFAPKSGEQTRRELQRQARRVSDQAQDFVSELSGSVGDTINQAKEKIGSRIDAARDAVELRRRQVTNAVEAGREAAQQARVELEQRIAETKAAYKES
jgi:gas vesicle protein